jgi:hypothetical protein
MTYGELLCTAIMALKDKGHIVCVRINNGPNVSVYSCEGSTLIWCSYADEPWEKNEFHKVNLDTDMRTFFIEDAGLRFDAQPR